MLPRSGRSLPPRAAPPLPAGCSGGHAAPAAATHPPAASIAAFIEPLLSGRWELGAEGPQAWDCWSLFRHAQAGLFGRAVPRVVLSKDTPVTKTSALLASHPGRALWRQVPAPAHGGAVELSSVRTPLHVGLWLAVDGGLVFHCAEPAGVQLDSLLTLRACGWRVLRFYEWAGDA